LNAPTANVSETSLSFVILFSHVDEQLLSGDFCTALVRAICRHPCEEEICSIAVETLKLYGHSGLLAWTCSENRIIATFNLLFVNYCFFSAREGLSALLKAISDHVGNVVTIRKLSGMAPYVINTGIRYSCCLNCAV
jgi:hypothetical protein